MRTLTILTLLTLPAPALAFADEPSSMRDVHVESFEDADRVEGALRGPLGDSIRTRRHTGRQTLVRPRAHFHPEMMRSVETL